MQILINKNTAWETEAELLHLILLPPSRMYRKYGCKYKQILTRKNTAREKEAELLHPATSTTYKNTENRSTSTDTLKYSQIKRIEYSGREGG